MRFSILALIFATAVLAQERPGAKFPVGKDTTILIEPLTPEGYVDYGKVLNERLGKGVRPEQNAMALLVQAFGPAPDGKATPPEYYQLLGVSAPPASGDYITTFREFCQKRYNADDDERLALSNQHNAAMHAPWTAKQFPQVAEWLAVNEKQLAIVAEAAARPRLFSPLVRQTGKDGKKFSQASSVITYDQPLRGAYAALTARAMLKTADGQIDAAWQDLAICLRLARLFANSVEVFEMLVGWAGEAIAAEVILMFLSESKLSAEQLRRCEADLRSLPGRRPLAEQVERCGRYDALSFVQAIHEDACVEMPNPADFGGLINLLLSSRERSEKSKIAARSTVDWALILRDQIEMSERLARLLAMKDRPRRVDEMRKFEGDIKAQTVAIYPLVKFLNDYLAWLPLSPIRAIRSRGLSLSLLLLRVTYRSLTENEDRCDQLERNRNLAVALARFKLARGKHPDKLDELVPTYLTAVPNDVFTDKPMIYSLTADGYLLYSVGVNGKDDGGKTYGDDLGADDIRVRMPMPKPK
jgi:hypothetical protein